MSDAEKAQMEEALKYSRALYVWPRRRKETPSGQSTWGGWFLQRYGQRVEQYREEVRQRVPDSD